MQRTNSQYDILGRDELDRKLDELLGVDLSPSGLSERIVRQTRRHLPAQRSVLARLGGSPLRVAAAIAIVCSLGALFYATGDTSRHGDTQLSLAKITTQLDQVANLSQAPDTSVDQQISEIKMQLATVQSSNVWNDPQAQSDDALAEPMAMPMIHRTTETGNF